MKAKLLPLTFKADGAQRYFAIMGNYEVTFEKESDLINIIQVYDMNSEEYVSTQCGFEDIVNSLYKLF